MEKNVFKIVCDNKDYDIIYFAESSRIAKVEKSLNIDTENITDLDEPITFSKREYGKGSVQITYMSARTCNLGCKYCFAGEGEYGAVDCKPKGMTLEKYMQSVESVLKIYPEGINGFSFFGGEPLLNFSEIKKFIPQCYQLFKERGLSLPQVGLITNLTLITDEILAFIKEYNIKVAISLDGDKELNDFARVTKNDAYSVYDKVNDGIRLLHDNNIEFAVQATINHNHLVHYIPGAGEKWVKDIEKTGCINFVMVPVETDLPGLKIEESDYSKLDMLYREVTNYYLNRLMKDEPEVFPTGLLAPMIQIIKNKTVNSCGAGHSILVDTDGSVYPCHMFCNNEDYRMGDIYKGVSVEKVNYLSNISRLDSPECQKCLMKKMCTYWCRGIQLNAQGDMYTVCPARCVAAKANFEECIKALAELEKGTVEYTRFWNNYKKVANKLKESDFVVQR